VDSHTSKLDSSDHSILDQSSTVQSLCLRAQSSRFFKFFSQCERSLVFLFPRINLQRGVFLRFYRDCLVKIRSSRTVVALFLPILGLFSKQSVFLNRFMAYCSAQREHFTFWAIFTCDMSYSRKILIVRRFSALCSVFSEITHT
jgi:hypothetical protein